MNKEHGAGAADNIGCGFVPLQDRREGSIEWAMVDGQPVHISAALRGRGLVYGCPECGQSMTARKGRKRRWHFAHAATTEPCQMYSRESREHYNTKLSLARALHDATHRCLRVAVACSRTIGGVHPATDERAWCADWDEVAIEYTTGGVRADIALLRGGVAVGLIEVSVTNPVSDEKEALLARLGVPWIEIGPGSNLDVDNRGRRTRERTWRWDLGRAVFATRVGPDPRGCPMCASFEVSRRRSGNTGWSQWVQEIHRATQEGRAVTVWQRDVRDADDGSQTLATLKIMDMLDAEHDFERRLLCLDDGAWVFTEWPRNNLNTTINDARENFREHQREFLRQLRLVCAIDVAGWECLETPRAPYAVVGGVWRERDGVKRGEAYARGERRS